MSEVIIGLVIENLAKELISLLPKLSWWGNLSQEIRESPHLLSEIVTLLNSLKETKYRSDGLSWWYQDLKYLVEDLKEAVADLKEDMKQKRGILSGIKKFFKPYSNIEDELKAITTRTRDLYDRVRVFHSVQSSQNSITKPLPVPAHADPKIFGRESEKKAIFDLLKTPSSYGECVYDFISIVGMGGIGKTTLAQHVYYDDNAASFPVKAWCHVSMDFNKCAIYQSIIQQLKPHCLIQDLSALEVELCKNLKGKKFLIVLDDYWSESVNDFNALRAPFMAAAPGSKFIVTTQNRAVAKRFTAEERIIDLGLLTKEDCWSLFCSDSRLTAKSRSYLVTVAKEICEKCDGLPLAVAVMKGMLSGIDDKAGWRVVLDDLISGKKITDVSSIIKRSYWDLPDHLQTCFALCTIFPKGHLFDRGSTVDFWTIFGRVPKYLNVKTNQEEMILVADGLMSLFHDLYLHVTHLVM